MTNFVFNLFIASVAILAFYNVYKGRGGEAAKGVKKGKKKDSGDSWFGN